MQKRFINSLILLFITASLFVVYSQMDWIKSHTNQFNSYEYITNSGYIRILIQNNPTTYYIDRDGNKAGFEYDLATSFAKSVNLTPKFIIKSSVADVLQSLANGEGDIAASGLSITNKRKKLFLFGPTYQHVTQQLVCRRGGADPDNLEQLQGENLHIIAGSSYEERLKKLKLEYKDLTWTTTDGIVAEDLLKQVWQKDIDCTIVDSNILAINQRYYPELSKRFTIGETDSIAWVMPKKAVKLQQVINEWYKEFSNQDGIENLHERYYGHVEIFDYVDTAAFIRRIITRYPPYSPYFQAAAEKYNISVTLLASQAYQESHWNPYAISPTGVRGIMMLTLNTAKSMGVKNRLDIEQSIMGGAKYLAKLRKTLSKTITEPDLTWYALASYNIGLGHLRDAQQLAKTMKRNPLKWHDLKEVLPLLSKRKYYKTLKYGYARGSEPVRYVQKVRQYEHTLIKQLNLLTEE